ncbi:MAG: hydantoinase B/oxoprolinase family protein [Gemmobacter sp.]
MAARYGLATLAATFARILNSSEALARAVVAAPPDGDDTATDIIDGDGVTDRPIPVTVTLRVRGDRLEADFTGCPPATDGPINCARGALHSAVRTVFKALVAPQAPSNEGWFRPLSVTAPDDTIFTAQKPRPTGWYYEGSVHASELVWKALAPLRPDRFSAGSSTTLSATYISGTGPDGHPFIHVEPQHGGWGATEDGDGAGGVIALTDGDTYNYSVEVIEAKFPLRVRRYGLNTEGGVGVGAFRGGHGLVREYEVLAEGCTVHAGFGRTRTVPWGMAGGGAGSANALALVRADGHTASHGRVSGLDVGRGDRVALVTGGGGVWGDPARRDPASVARDVQDGLITAAEAGALYPGGAMIRLATDVGGTFTDLVGHDEATGALFRAKALTTPQDQSGGVLDTIAAARGQGMEPGRIGLFAHGGTTVINAITERKGVRTALVTTAGFRDVLEIGRGSRPDLYNLRFHSPAPFVPRHLRFEVRERLDATGAVVEPLVPDDLPPIAAACIEAGVEAVGIVFLHSYANPAHEAAAAAALAALLPGVTICASHEISREWREYERSNTVALNASVQPIIRRYFARLEAALARDGVACPAYAMQSNGGIATFAQAADRPLTLVESGPAGGVAGAARIGQALGAGDGLSLDVGGTTAKCSLIRDGRPHLDTAYRMERTRVPPGYPVQVPVVDIVETGAGGGSIAGIDRRGGLRVGPESAGSQPGPACSGRGGDQRTVTDALVALVALGVFDPLTFANGTLPLDAGLARAAIARVAGPMGLDPEAAAQAIVDVTLANMINALKLVTVQRGHDPRDAALVVGGGAGPALAARPGREMQTRCTVIPPHPGIFSAWGMLAARPRADFRETYFTPLSDAALARVLDLFGALKGRALDHFGHADAAVGHEMAVDAR